LGGRVAEEIVFNRISTGASNDIKRATEVAQKMVRSWGMSDELGPLSYAKGEEHVFLGREIAQHRDYSDTTARKIDEEITKLINNAYKRAKKVIKENVDVLHALADLLLEKETVMGAELDELISSMKPGFEFPSKHGEDQEKVKETQAQAETKAENIDTAEAQDAEEPETVTKTEASDK
jgi:cell division protease FtsH